MTWTPGNRLILLRSGGEYFPALAQAIRSAQHEIFLESYLYRPDKTGRFISAQLVKAARRGVVVHLLIDGFGASALPERLRQTLAKAGVRLLFFRPETFAFKVSRERLRRLHRKLASIDGQVGFVGGINIIDDQSESAIAPRYDYALQVEGPLCAEIRASLAKQWRQTCWMQLKSDWAKLPPQPATPKPAGNTNAQLLKRDNLRHRRDIEAAYLHAINHARDEIILAHAYFLPGITLRHALLNAAARGVKVTLLLQGRIDHVLIYFATRVLYRPLLAAGIQIHEYHAGFMHAKVAVIDKLWFTVGSSNIDPFSLLTAREANIVARDTFLANALRDNIQLHIEQDATQITASSKRHTGWRAILPWLAYQVVRLLLGLTGYGRREYRE